jgi:2-polyprenyl-3-methyl-5-hydroxy-6-metoxy-1,4-benzoquinol methylase
MKSTDFNPSYIGQRNDMLNLIPRSAKKILDVGCSVGTLGKQIKQKYNVEVVGLEVNKEMALTAKNNLDKVIIADAEALNFNHYFPAGYFECIIFADILEHLKDPWSVLTNISDMLSEEGVVIASIPNIRHYTTIIELVVKGYWPYRERGIHDKTHLRFFTLKNIKEMFGSSGLKINKIERNYRIIERPHPYNKFSRYFALPIIKEFLTFQYLIVAQKKRVAENHEDFNINP